MHYLYKSLVSQQCESCIPFTFVTKDWNSLQPQPPLLILLFVVVLSNYPENIQMIQNAVAHTVYCKPRLVSPLLWELPWLPICFRVQDKILVIPLNALHALGAVQLEDDCSPLHPFSPPGHKGTEVPCQGSPCGKTTKKSLLGGCLQQAHFI